MITTIRTRITALIAVVFLSVLILLLAAGSAALYTGLTRETDRILGLEREHMLSLFEPNFIGLAAAGDQEKDNLTDALLQEIDKNRIDKHYFVIFSLTSEKGRRIFNGGSLKNIPLSLPKGFFSRKDGRINMHLENKQYRILIQRRPWGVFVVGVENQVFAEVAEEFRKIMIVGIPITFILVLAMGQLLAGFAMKPAADAAREADKITLSSLKKRLPEYRGKDGFGVLVATLNRMIVRIEDGVKRIQQFTQDAAHELRTPITILRGELELIYRKGTLTGKDHASLRKSLDQAISLGRIVEDLMLLARSDSGDLPIQKCAFRLDQVVKEILEDVRAMAEKRPIEVVLKECERIDLYGDESLIRRLLLNLSDNALKYTRQGRIEFSLNHGQSEAHLTIKDTGIGISKKDLPHVFDRFYRGVDTSRTDSSRGSGLGLAISLWIVHAHGGEMKIDSALSRGTIVDIVLPIAPRQG